MPRRISAAVRNLNSWCLSLSHRERLLVIFALGCIAAIGLQLSFTALRESINDMERMLTVRTKHLEQLAPVLQRYTTLKQRLEKMQSTYAASELTFEALTSHIDKVVRDSIGSDNYDLKKGRSSAQIGFDYEKQEFSLNVKSLSLDQLTKLLYQLEQGDKPLFLGKVDITKARDNTFGATLEIFSIRKSQA